MKDELGKGEMSRLVLGTVQLGMLYGLNTQGAPTKDQAFAILDAALEGGINTFDTALAYGTAEEVVGEWVESRQVRDRVFIISKMRPHALNDYPDGTKASDIVKTEIEKSLERLRTNMLDGYLLHTPSYVYLSHVINGLQKAKESGLVSNIGISVYDETEALQAARLKLDFIQIPYNILDQRIDQTDFWKLVEDNGTTVFARSPFLQGLLVMDPKNIPAHIAYARPYVEDFQDIALRNNLSPAKAALLFSFVCSRAQHVVVGAETVGQIEENFDIIQSATMQPWMEEVKARFQKIERAVVNPSLWTMIKK